MQKQKLITCFKCHGAGKYSVFNSDILVLGKEAEKEVGVMVNGEA